MSTPVVSLRGVSVRYGRTMALDAVDLDLEAGRAVGVLGRNGAGKTTLLRLAVGLVAPDEGVRRLAAAGAGGTPAVAYFAGEATLPGAARAAAWGQLGTGEALVTDRRPVRALSRGLRQLLGLRTVLGRQPLHVVVLDEPWEGLDDDGARWLARTLEAKRDKGAAVMLASQRLSDLAPLCDDYLVLEQGRATRLRALDLAPDGVPSERAIAAAVERVIAPVARRLERRP